MTVASLATITTSVPLTLPMPVTMPAPGASSSYMPFAASGDSSRKAEPGSSNRSIRSRTGSLPRSRCRAIDRSSPAAPRSLIAAVLARSSATSARMAALFARASSLVRIDPRRQYRHRRDDMGVPSEPYPPESIQRAIRAAVQGRTDDNPATISDGWSSRLPPGEMTTRCGCSKSPDRSLCSGRPVRRSILVVGAIRSHGHTEMASGQFTRHHGGGASSRWKSAEPESPALTSRLAKAFTARCRPLRLARAGLLPGWL